MSTAAAEILDLTALYRPGPPTESLQDYRARMKLRYEDPRYDPIAAALASLPKSISDPKERAAYAELIRKVNAVAAPEIAVALELVTPSLTDPAQRVAVASCFTYLDFSEAGNLDLPNFHDRNYEGPRPWMEWPEPPELHYLWRIDRQLSGLQLRDGDGPDWKKFSYEVFHDRYCHGESLRGHAYLKFSLKRALPKQLPAAYHEYRLPIVPQGAADVLERLCPGQIEFLELDLETAPGVELREKLYAMNVRNVVSCVHPYSPGYRVDQSGPSMIAASGKQLNFMAYDKIKDFQIFRTMEGYNEVNIKKNVKIALDRAGYKVDFNYDYQPEHAVGVFFPDGACYHPILMPTWPPEKIDTPDKMFQGKGYKMPYSSHIDYYADALKMHALNNKEREHGWVFELKKFIHKGGNVGRRWNQFR